MGPTCTSKDCVDLCLGLESQGSIPGSALPMARYRIVSRPLRFDLKQSIYDVEEYVSMEFLDGSIAKYWNYVDDFHSIEDAREYVEALTENRFVVAEID